MLRNIWLLSAMQALMMSGNTLLITTSALVGFSLATDKSLATLPLASQFLATMLMTIPASLWMQKVGRRVGFATGTLLGLLGAVTLSYAVFQQQFWLFVIGTILIGMFNGFGMYYRFAAVEVATDEYKSRAISYVMAGGVFAALVGPNLANWTRDWTEIPFASSYLVIAGLYIISLLALFRLRLPKPVVRSKNDSGRRLSEIMLQPVFIVAVMGGMFGFAVMSLVMTATPLAMEHHPHPFSDIAFVIQWHVLGMFVPSFFTGHLIRRWGVLKIMLLGAIFNLLCVLINLTGTSLWHYWTALVLLGVGWNFLFVGGTTLLTEAYRAEESARVQAINDFMVYSMVTLASVTAGALQYQFG
ncbi:MAG: MFS transporter [Gammaproteobacteria bacterium]|nr:MFS transporter [Gammaproteobacteria bacterium]